MAAGLTLDREHYDTFAEAFAREAERRWPDDGELGAVMSDGELDTIDLELAEAIRAGGPWGQGFPEPTFDAEFDVISCLKELWWIEAHAYACGCAGGNDVARE